jgi:HEPN domain-containing protein
MNAGRDEPATESWRRLARRDWRRLHLLLDTGDTAGAGFFLQQALEKLLKGYLIERGWRLRKTHELDRLLDAAVAYGPQLIPYRALCERVSGYYLIERYPDADMTGSSPEQLRVDLEEAKQFVLALFPDEELP